MPEFSQCRLCLGVSSTAGIDLFKECRGSIYSAKIKKALNVELQEIPSWPRKACLACIVLLQKISTFRNLVLENEQKLRDEFGQAEAEQQMDSLSDDDHQDAHEEVERKWDEEMDTIDLVASDTDAQDMSPPRGRSPESVLDIDEYPTQAEDSPVPLVRDEEEKVQEIDSSNSDVDKIPESNISSPSEDQPDETHTSSSSRPPAKPTAVDDSQPERVSVVRVLSTPILTEEEVILEQQMLDMRLFVCKVCAVDCNTLPKLREHVDKLHDTKTYEICCHKRVRISVSHLYDHIRWHLNPDAFKCKICGSDYPDSHCLSQHMLHLHSEGPPKYVCEVCGRGFFAKGKLKAHRIIHKKTTCKYCGKELSRNTLVMHIKTEHEMELHSLCEICGRGFPSRSRLMTHIMDHGGPHGGRRKKKPKLIIPTPEKGVFGDNYFK